MLAQTSWILVWENIQRVDILNHAFVKGEEAKVVLHPESIYLSKEGTFKSKVLESTFMGSTQDYVLDFHGNELKVQDFNPSDKRVYLSGEDIGFDIASKSIF